MSRSFQIDQYTIFTIDTEREINFQVEENGNYLFRLVPGYERFELSKLDQALLAEIDYRLVGWIGDKIDRYFS